MLDLLFYFLLGLIIIGFEISRKKYFIIDHITMFNFFFFLVYSFTPISLILRGTKLINDDMPYGVEYFGNNIFTSSIVFASYLFFILGYIFKSYETPKHTLVYTTMFNTKLVVKLLPFLYLFLFAIFYVYVSEFGGLSRAIELSEAYRSGAIKFHRFAFVERFFPLNTILLYYLYYKVMLEKKDEHRFALIIYFMFSILFSTLIMAVYSSRGFIIFEVAGLYVVTAMYYRDYFIKYMIPAVIVALLVILYGKPLFNSIADLFKYGFDAFLNGFLNRLELINQEEKSIISNFTHPIVSLECSLAHSGFDVDLRYFKDIWYAFFSLLPNELLGIKDPHLLMQLNTLLLQGQDVEQILPGILGFFSYQLQVIGVFIGAFLYGILGAYLYKVFIAFYENSKASIVFIYLITMSYGYFVFRGSPVNLLQEKFILLFVLGVITLGSSFIFKKRESLSWVLINLSYEKFRWQYQSRKCKLEI